MQRIKREAFLAALAVAALMLATSVGMLAGNRLLIFGCDRATSVLYEGVQPEGLVLVLDSGSIEVVWDSEAPKASIVLEYCRGCAVWNTSNASGIVRIRVENKCGDRFSLLGFSDSARVKVVLPEKSVDSIVLHVNAGSVEVGGISVGVLSASVGAGSVEAWRLTVERKLNISVDAGSVEARGLYLADNSSARIRARVGSVEVYLENSGAHVVAPQGVAGVRVEVGCEPAPEPRVEVGVDVGSVAVLCGG